MILGVLTHRLCVARLLLLPKRRRMREPLRMLQTPKAMLECGIRKAPQTSAKAGEGVLFDATMRKLVAKMPVPAELVVAALPRVLLVSMTMTILRRKLTRKLSLFRKR